MFNCLLTRMKFDQIIPKQRVMSMEEDDCYLQTATSYLICTFVLAFLYETWMTFKIIYSKPFKVANYTRLVFPRFIHNLQFAISARSVLDRAYFKFRTRAFQLIRGDGQVVILPQQYLEELSSLPSSIASPQIALEHDLLGSFTGLNLILESRLHHSIVQRKLTPRLHKLCVGLQQELTDAVDEIFPSCPDWTLIQPYNLLAKISARLSARALVGPVLCRNPVWLDISVNFTESLFRTIVILRTFPSWTHLVISKFLPSYWAGFRFVRAAKRLLGPHIDQMIRRSDDGTWIPTGLEDSHVMAWLADTAKGKDRDAEVLAHVQVLLALASVHTTLLRMVNVLYDIIAHPEYIQDLVDEIREESHDWNHDTYSKLHKLDSVLRESQRLSPPTILGMKRMFQQGYTFTDGLRIPCNTYVCMPTFAIENDPTYIENPEMFDGYRSWRLRQERGQQDRHQFTSTDSNALNFGYGKSACPGRYFASLVIKMVFVKLLTTYEFKFLPGQSRPRNIIAHEFLFPWPWDRIMVRKKQEAECPF